MYKSKQETEMPMYRFIYLMDLISQNQSGQSITLMM